MADKYSKRPVRLQPGTDTGPTPPKPHRAAVIGLAVMAILAIAVVATFSASESEKQVHRAEATKQAE
jgi:hypothetical protein